MIHYASSSNLPFNLPSIPSIIPCPRYGAPSGFFCAPKTIYPFTGELLLFHYYHYRYNSVIHAILIFVLVDPSKGFWDYTYWCDNPWNDPPEYCDVYEGQKSGRFDNTVAVANRAGRSDVEGCWYVTSLFQCYIVSARLACSHST